MSKKPSFLSKNWPMLLVLLYVISPIDFLPDDIPLIGNVDDAGILLIEIFRQYLEHKKNVKETPRN